MITTISTERFEPSTTTIHIGDDSPLSSKKSYFTLQKRYCNIDEDNSYLENNENSFDKDRKDSDSAICNDFSEIKNGMYFI